MTTNLEWDPPLHTLPRAGASDAYITVDSLENDLPRGFASLWNDVAEYYQRFAGVSDELLVEVQVWMEGGSLIAIVSTRRELGRLVLNVPEIDKAYHELADSDELLEHGYRRLFECIATAARNSVVSDGMDRLKSCKLLGATVVIQDADDETTREVLWEG